MSFINIKNDWKMTNHLGSTPLYALSIEEFTELLDERIKAAINNEAVSMPAAKPAGRLVYGLKGIRELFGVSHLTVQRYKDGILAPAIKQNGRKIVVDVDYAMELFNEKERNGRK